MRLATLALAFVVLAALPAASAFESVTVTTDEQNVHLEGTTVRANQLEDAPVIIVGEITVEDVDVSLSQSSCTLSTKLDTDDALENQQSSCSAGQVASSRDATELVAYDLQVRLPAEAADPAAEDDMTTSAATIVAATNASQTAILAAAAATASLGAFYVAWRVLKWTGMAAFIPLYSHIRDDDLLNDPNRAGIYNLIQAEPGISTKDIATRLGLAWGTVTHHLHKLEKRRFVVSKKYGKYRRFFLNGQAANAKKDELAVLRVDRTGDVAACIQAFPGITQKEVGVALGVSSSTILWHVKRLVDVGLIEKIRDGKVVRYYANATMGEQLVSGAATA